MSAVMTPERLDEIEKRAATAIKGLEVGGMAGAFLAVAPLMEDIPLLCAKLRAALRVVEAADNMSVLMATPPLKPNPKWGPRRNLMDALAAFHTACAEEK